MDYVVVNGHSSLNLASNNFTIRFRVRYESHSQTYNMILSWISGGSYVQLTYKGVDQKYRFITNTWTEGSGQSIDSGVTIPSNGQWYYVVLVRSGNDFSWYIDNTLSGTANRTAAVTNTSSIDLRIGADNTAGRELHGWIDELEIINGTAITDFSVPASELTVQANTALLYNFNGSDGQKSATDSSVNSHVSTFYNNAQLDSAQFVYGGTSLALNVADFTNNAKYRFFNVG